MIFDIFPKINVFLKIIGINEGYHLLSSRFVLVKNSFKDKCCIKQSNSFSLKGDFGCQLEDNIIYKVIMELKKHLEKNKQKTTMLKNLDIEVEKKIPKGSGLGGGSADGGMILRKINDMFDLNLSTNELCLIASKAGGDVAFFASGYDSANVYGFGEIIEPFFETSYEFEILTPDVFCDTSRVYKEYDKSNPQINFIQTDLDKQNSDKILSTYSKDYLNDLYLPALNVYEDLHQLDVIKDDRWFFSGSGSSFFRIRHRGEK